MVGENSLILTVTRRCNLRCSYCPTVKDGWPSLSAADVRKGIELFEQLYGGGVIKIFGGEPLLEPERCKEIISLAQQKPSIRYVYLSTNGLGLTTELLSWMKQQSKLILTLSMDGLARDHRRMRRPLAESKETVDSYHHIRSLLPELLRVPRLVITQTIAPATARNAVENFEHLLELGFQRFNFLPGYFVPWRPEQLLELQQGFNGIGKIIKARWSEGQYLYVRNLFVRAPTPFFNQGLIVDSDSTIHPSNIGLSGSFDHLHQETTVGTLSEPPTRAQIEHAAATVNALIQRTVSARIWNATLAADAELTKLCEHLMPHFLRYKHRRKRLVKELASDC